MFDTALFLKRTELKLLLALKPKPNFSDQSQVIQVQNQISNTKSNLQEAKLTKICRKLEIKNYKVILQIVI